MSRGAEWVWTGVAGRAERRGLGRLGVSRGAEVEWLVAKDGIEKDGALPAQWSVARRGGWVELAWYVARGARGAEWVWTGVAGRTGQVWAQRAGSSRGEARAGSSYGRGRVRLVTQIAQAGRVAGTGQTTRPT
jgi:hypothetical protein